MAVGLILVVLELSHQRTGRVEKVLGPTIGCASKHALPPDTVQARDFFNSPDRLTRQNQGLLCWETRGLDSGSGTGFASAYNPHPFTIATREIDEIETELK